ncbi:MAG TPA: fibronectin type III domain-containing protein, partial [Actinomycetales bacterium]|nr:fibronectin type III domain-containing protein [Actinomycetales bacterium]
RVWTDRQGPRGTWLKIAERRLPASARSLTVKGLTSAQGYRVRVSAVNRSGTGASSFRVLSPR